MHCEEEKEGRREGEKKKSTDEWIRQLSELEVNMNTTYLNMNVIRSIEHQI